MLLALRVGNAASGGAQPGCRAFAGWQQVRVGQGARRFAGRLAGRPLAGVCLLAAATLPRLLGDVNGDGVVNITDATNIGLHWFETGPPGWIPEDVTRDGIVNISDMTMVGIHWGEHLWRGHLPLAVRRH